MFYKLFDTESLRSWTPLEDGEFDILWNQRQYKPVKDVAARSIIYGYEHFGFSFPQSFRKQAQSNLYVAMALGAYSNTMMHRNGIWPEELQAPIQPDYGIYFLALGTPLGEDMKIALNLFAEEAAKAFEGSEFKDEYFKQLHKTYEKLEELYNKFYKDRIPTAAELEQVAAELMRIIPQAESETQAFAMELAGTGNEAEEEIDPDSLSYSYKGSSVSAMGENGEQVEVNFIAPGDDMFARHLDMSKIPSNRMPELSDLSGKWGSLQIEEHPNLTHSFNPNLRPFVRDKLNDEGVYPKRIDRLPIDGRIFRTKGKMDIAGAVLIDQSGSMGLNAEHIRALMDNMPGVLIASYCGEGRRGVLRVIARKNRCLPTDQLNIAMGGNIVDGPALLWLMQQRGPRVWISDGRVTGIGDDSYSNLRTDVARIVRWGNIIRVPDLHNAIKGGANLTGAIRGYMKRGI